MSISYFNANPDVARAYEENQNGMTPDAFANYHYANYGGSEGRAAPIGQVPAATTPAPVALTSPAASPPMTVNDLYTQILGRAPDEGGLAFWQSAFGGSVDPTEQASFMQAAQAELARRPATEQQQLAPNLFNTNTSNTGNVATTGATTGNVATNAATTGNVAATGATSNVSGLNNNNVVALGDSTTYGYNAGNQLDTNMVSSAQNTLGSGYTVNNLGVNSTTVGDLLTGAKGTGNNWANTLAGNAGIVVLNYGLNEASRGEDPETFRANLLSAVNQAKAAGKKVVLQTPNSVGSDISWGNNVGAYADVIRDVASSTGSALDDKFTYTSGRADIFDTTTGDTLHPSGSTYNALGVNLANTIAALNAPVATNAALTPDQIQQDIIKTERNRLASSTDGIASLKPKPIDTSATNVQQDIGFSPATVNSTVATTPATTPAVVAPPTTIEELYRSVLGREGEKDGLEFWKKNFGDTVDAAEAASFKTAAGTEIANRAKSVNDLYASIGRTGMGTEANQVDKAGFDYWNQIAGSGLTPEQLTQRFNTEVNQFLIDKKDDPYSKYVAPIYLKSITDNISKDTTLSAFDKNNKIFETAQQYGMDDAAIDKAFGKTAADAYRTQYGTQIKDFITTSLAKDEGTTFDEIATIKNEARTRGLDANEIAKYSGMNKAGVDTLFDSYDKGLANLAKGFDEAKTKAGTDATALSEAEVNKAKTMLALQNQYKVTDEDLAKASGTTVKAVQDYLNPVKDAPKTLEALMNDTKMSGAEIRAKIEELKTNPAVSGIYGAALQKFSDKAAKDYSGEYGGKNYESLNPIAVGTVLDQLKAQQAAGTAQYYQGGASGGKKGGFGSLDAMTEDMAKNLVAAGITDIRQVGEIPVYTPVQEIGKTYNGKRVVTQSDEDGRTFTYYVEPGEPDSEGNATNKFVALPKDAKLESIYGLYDGYETTTPVDSSKVTKDKDGKMVTQTGTTAGNKVTGEPLSKASNYAERTGGNSWSGTFRGKGNTGYNVQFKDGNPIFYTSGASSSDMQQLAPLLAIASFVPQLAPFVAAINTAYAASEGNWKGALLSALPMAGDIAGKLGANAGTVSNINSASKIANVANAIDNKDLLSLAMSGAGLASDKNLFGTDAFNPSANVVGNLSTKDLLTGASAFKALKNEDLVSLANIGAQMSGSKDAATAAKGLAVVKALESKNPMAIAQIAQKYNLTNDVIGKAGGGLASLPGLIKNDNKNTLTDKTAFDGLNGSLVAKMLNQQPPAVRAAMLKKIMQTA